MKNIQHAVEQERGHRLHTHDFREALLAVMERKEHWAWPAFTTGLVPKHLLHIHFEQEYATYVRDFPVLVGRAYVQCPLPEVRRELAENLYEEETGGLVAGKPHPELFLEYPRGLGMDLKRFAAIALLPEASAYRQTLDDVTLNRGWEVAGAVVTLFIEGTSKERGEIDPTVKRTAPAPLEAHPLVVHYGLALEHLALTKAHRQVEGEHRQGAWRSILQCDDDKVQRRVIDAMQTTLAAWLRYRDAVAHACGIVKDNAGAPVAKSR